MVVRHMLSRSANLTLALALLAGTAGAQMENKKGNGNGNGLPNVVVLATGGTIAGAAATDV
jgi:L-asparaginase/Glu-tRNA(Gln) amidotransferase subunit D